MYGSIVIVKNSKMKLNEHKIPKERFFMPRTSIESATQLCLNFEYLYDKCIILKVLHDQTPITLTFFICHHILTPIPYIKPKVHSLFLPKLLLMKEKISSNHRKIEGKQLKVHILLSNSIHTMILRT